MNRIGFQPIHSHNLRALHLLQMEGLNNHQAEESNHPNRVEEALQEVKHLEFKRLSLQGYLQEEV